jgi:hypothetical protein
MIYRRRCSLYNIRWLEIVSCIGSEPQLPFLIIQPHASTLPKRPFVSHIDSLQSIDAQDRLDNAIIPTSFRSTAITSCTYTNMTEQIVFETRTYGFVGEPRTHYEWWYMQTEGRYQPGQGPCGPEVQFM